MDPLPAADLDVFLVAHAGWRLERGRLCREYAFAGFQEAFGFMAACALAAEQADHHPRWTNVWNRVEVELWTHTADAVTRRDVDLATRMDALAASFA